jgi:hypothetical protein
MHPYRCPRMMPMKMLLSFLMGGKTATLSPSTLFAMVFLRDMLQIFLKGHDKEMDFFDFFFYRSVRHRPVAQMLNLFHFNVEFLEIFVIEN